MRDRRERASARRDESRIVSKSRRERLIEFEGSSKRQRDRAGEHGRRLVVRRVRRETTMVNAAAGSGPVVVCLSSRQLGNGQRSDRARGCMHCGYAGANPRGSSGGQQPRTRTWPDREPRGRRAAQRDGEKERPAQKSCGLARPLTSPPTSFPLSLSRSFPSTVHLPQRSVWTVGK